MGRLSATCLRLRRMVGFSFLFFSYLFHVRSARANELSCAGGSNPTLNDIPHTFTFYLFPQPDNFELPAWDAGRNYTALGAPDRLNFSVSAIADIVGAPVAANYYRTYNRSNTATGSFSNGTCPISLAGGGASGNSTSGGSGNGNSGSGAGGTGTTPPPAEFTGLAGKVEGSAGYLLAAVGVAAFAMV